MGDIFPSARYPPMCNVHAAGIIVSLQIGTLRLVLYPSRLLIEPAFGLLFDLPTAQLPCEVMAINVYPDLVTYEDFDPFQCAPISTKQCMVIFRAVDHVRLLS